MTNAGKSFGGIDPGKSGCLAVIRPDGSVEFYDVPTVEVEMTTKTKLGNKKHKRVYLPAAMASIVRDAHLDLVTIERAQAMPSFKGGRMVPQGAVSAFASGEGYGIWQGICAALEVPYQLVSANRWKAQLMDGQPKTKEASIPAVCRLYPSVASQLRGPRGAALVDRADALMLAHFGRILPALAPSPMA